MINGATQVLFEGVPTHPDAGRAWDIVDKYKVCSQLLVRASILLSQHEHVSWVLLWEIAPPFGNAVSIESAVPLPDVARSDLMSRLCLSFLLI